MSRRGSAKPPLVIDVRSYSDKDAKTTYLVETSYEQANTTARGAAAVEQRFSAFQDLHAAITEPLNLGAFPVARVWYATDAVKKERVDRLHEYLAVVAEKAGATPPAELLAFLGVDAGTFAAGGGGTAPGAARVLGRELPPLVWEVVWEEADAPPPNALAAAMARAALRERSSGEKLGAVDEAPSAGDGRSAEAPPPHPYADGNAIMAADAAATERAAAAADAEAPVATGGGSAADADAAAAAPPPSPGYRVGQRILSEADGGEWRPGRIIGRRVVGGAPQLKVSVDGYDSDQDEWVDAASARVRALSSVASHNDEGASPGRPRGESAADARREQIRLGAEAAAAAAASSAAAAAATPMAASAGTPATAAPPTPQRVVELEKVNAQLLARIAELEKATRLEVAALEKRAAAIAAPPPAAADGEADALRMKVSELQDGAEGEGGVDLRRAGRGPPAGESRGEGEDESRLAGAAAAALRRAPLRRAAMARGGGRRSEPASLAPDDADRADLTSRRCARAALFTPGVRDRRRRGDAAARRARVAVELRSSGC